MPATFRLENLPAPFSSEVLCSVRNSVEDAVIVCERCYAGLEAVNLRGRRFKIVERIKLVSMRSTGTAAAERQDDVAVHEAL